MTSPIAWMTQTATMQAIMMINRRAAHLTSGLSPLFDGRFGFGLPTMLSFASIRCSVSVAFVYAATL